jgi:hypothetical protein
MKSRAPMTFAAVLAAGAALGSSAVTVNAQNYGYGYGYGHDFGRDRHQFRGFVPGCIVLSGTVYVGDARTVTAGEVLPPGCLNTGSVTNPAVATVNVPVLPADVASDGSTVPVTVSCGYASDNGEAPNLHDNHNVSISLNGDNGADPNKLVKVTDQLSATQLSTTGYLDRFVTIRSARAGEAFRGVALAPVDGR